MSKELEVFNKLLDTMESNSRNNEALITDVKFWAKTWRREMKNETEQKEELLNRQEHWLMTHTDLEVEKIVEFKEIFK